MSEIGNEPQRLVTVREACRYGGFSHTKCYQLLNAGPIDAYKRDGRTLIDPGTGDYFKRAGPSWNWRMRSGEWKRGKFLGYDGRGKLMKAVTNKRAALYARFSSDLQKDKSIDRQFADLEKAARRLGFKLDKRYYFADRAQTAT